MRDTQDLRSEEGENPALITLVAVGNPRRMESMRSTMFYFAPLRKVEPPVHERFPLRSTSGQEEGGGGKEEEEEETDAVLRPFWVHQCHFEANESHKKDVFINITVPKSRPEWNMRFKRF